MDNNNSIVNIGRDEYTLTRARLKSWLALEDLRLSIKKAAEDGDEQLVELIYSYLSAAFGVHDIIWSSLEWIRVAELYITAQTINLPTLSFPILTIRVQDDREVSWDYEGRTWYLWSHLIMAKYGWSIQYTADMDIDDALALIQEILIEEQTAKEWDWSLSDKAYKYNEHTKVSEFVPLEKPEWMRVQREIKPIEEVRMPIKFAPVGNVVSYGVTDAEPE